MPLNPYLWFNGQCETAFKLYEKVLGGKIESKITHGESPEADKVSADWRNKIMHATLRVGDNVLMGSDIPPQYYKKPQAFSVSFSLKDPAKAESIFKALSEKGVVEMPLQKTFWAQKFGMFTDQFGIPWMINCE
jgi:PhnB protein